MRQYLGFVVAAAGVVAGGAPLSAQQTLFNVPSAETTARGDLFFQQQFNFNRSIQSNTTLSYGLGHDFELGLNVFSLGVLPQGGADADPSPPLFLVNAQKGFDLGETFRFGLGTELGSVADDLRSEVRLANFSYLTGVAKLPDERGRLYAGAYFANGTYRGRRGDPFGFMVGYDIPVVPDRFHLVGDYISGRSGISVAVLGGMVQVSERWNLSLGAQIPSPHSGNFYGGVFELTYIPGGSDRRGRDAGRDEDHL